MTERYGPMQEVNWYSQKLLDIDPEYGPTDEAVDLALMVYGNWVVDERATHFFLPYLQIENGCELWIHCQTFAVADPDSGVLKRHVLRDYVMRGEAARLDDMGWPPVPDYEHLLDAVEGVMG